MAKELSAAELAAENQRLQDLLNQREKQIEAGTETEKQIRAKMAVGLTREQAVAAVKHQADFTTRNQPVKKAREEQRAKTKAGNTAKA